MKLNTTILTILGLVLFSCGGGDSSGGSDDPGPTDDDVAMIPPPGAATLLFPEDNTECNTGEVISDTQSDVRFEWNASQNTDSYQVSVTNLNSNNTSTVNSPTNEAVVRIERGTPYQWFVTSFAAGTNETAVSATWRFYNEGQGIENYAPFPAEVVFPTRGSAVDSASSILLEWSASDIDDDIASYEVVFGTDAANLESRGETTSTTIEVSITSGTVYYWQVITVDSAENSSLSEVFEFRVN